MRKELKYSYWWVAIVMIHLLLSSFDGAAATIQSAKSGDWFTNTTWVGGAVPGVLDDVVITDKHTVNIFAQSATNFTLTLCGNLTVQSLGILTIGHNNASKSASINISGNLLCDGVIWRGTKSGTTMNDYNSLLIFSVNANDVSVAGKGYISPQSIQFNVNSANRSISIAHYYIVTDQDFYIDANFPVNLSIERYAYMYVRRNFGLTGQTYATMKSTTAVNCALYGTVMAGNVWLLNPSGSIHPTVLEIKSQGALTANAFNKDASQKNSAPGFSVILNTNSTLRSAYGGNDPKVLAQNDPNLQIVQNQGRVIGWNTIRNYASKDEIQSLINPYLPKNSSKIEADFSTVYSASHISGWYHFTDKPFLVEGKDALKELGSTHIKLSFGVQPNKPYDNYPFNHNWPDYEKLIDYAKDPNWVNVFSDNHYKKYTFWVTPRGINNGIYKQGAHVNLALFWQEEEEYYELAKHLLQTYPNKEFVFQNWEGDWMLRGSGVMWERDPSLIPAKIETWLEGMRRMFQSRQRGVERAREEVGGSSRVMHAIEINKLYYNSKTMMEAGVPSLTGDIVPHCRLDLISWSSYDGIGSLNYFPKTLANGIEVLDAYVNPTGYCEKLPVQIGEIALNENRGSTTKAEFELFYERLAGLARYKNLQAYFLWNLYCTGNDTILVKGKEYDPAYLTPHMDGKWVIKPDGTYGISGQKFLSFKNKLNIARGKVYRVRTTPALGEYATISAALTKCVNPIGFSTRDTIDVLGTFTGANIINKSVVIRGYGWDNTILQGEATAPDASSEVTGAVISIASGCNVDISNLIVRYGKNTTTEGGGISIVNNKAGKTILQDLKVHDNFNGKAGGIGIVASNTDIIRSYVYNNTATGNGGGLGIYTNNEADGNHAVVNIQDCTISNNTAQWTAGGGMNIDGLNGYGTGVANWALTVNITNSNIVNNISKTLAGGVGLKGRGVSSTETNTTVNVNYSTIAYNSVTTYGGDTKNLGFGISDPNFNTGCPIVKVTNSIIAQNISDATQRYDVSFGKLQVQEVKNSILGMTYFPTPKPITPNTTLNVASSALKLETELRLREGNVPVLPILSGSVAIDYLKEISVVEMVDIDQRGWAREPLKSDVGSYEFRKVTGLQISAPKMTLTNSEITQLSFTLTPAEADASTYTYVYNGEAVNVSPTGLVTAMKDGTTTVVAKSIDNPDVSSNELFFTVGFTSIDSNHEYKMPKLVHPFTEKLLLQNVLENDWITLYSTDGTVTYDGNYKHTGVPVPNLAVGLYLLKIKSINNNIMVMKVIKQ